MDFDRARPKRCALAIGWRAVVLAALAYTVIALLAQTQLYATAVVVAGMAAWVVADIARLIARLDRSAEQDFERLAQVGSDIPVASLADVPRANEAFERAAYALNAARTGRQQQLEYLQTLLDTVAAALIVIDEQGRVTLANRAARALTSGPVDTLDEIAALGPAGARQLLALAPGARAIASLAEGRRVFVAVSQFGVPGRPPQRLLSLQRIAGDLDAVELKAWQDMADVLTHEMMNSLTPIASLSESLETLLRGHANSEVAGALEAIKRRSRGLLDFVGRYRAVAELPAPQSQRVRMDDLLRGIDRLLIPTFKQKGIAYRSSVRPHDIACMADPQLLEQAIINLLRNAADAVADADEPRVDVTCEVRDDRMVLAISDNGCGVPDARREQIFVPFFTTKTGGSGIGLSLARQVVLGHGGQLDVRANGARGTVFSMTLPVAHQN